MGEGRARAPPHTRTSLCDLLCDCPTGKSLKTCPALAQKIFRFAFTPNHSYNSRHPAPTRGAYRDRHGRWVRGAVAAARRARNTSSQGELAHERRPRADERRKLSAFARVRRAGTRPGESSRRRRVADGKAVWSCSPALFSPNTERIKCIKTKGFGDIG